MDVGPYLVATAIECHHFDEYHDLIAQLAGAMISLHYCWRSGSFGLCWQLAQPYDPDAVNLNWFALDAVDQERFAAVTAVAVVAVVVTVAIAAFDAAAADHFDVRVK